MLEVFDWPLVEALHAGEALVVMEKRLYVWGSGACQHPTLFSGSGSLTAVAKVELGSSE